MGASGLKLCVNLTHVQKWYAGDFRGVLDIARLADEAGIDQISVADHLVMSEEGIADYPYGSYYQAIDDPWLEPIAYLGALSAATRRIELSTGILIAPLRSAVLLAKQIATLDVLSGGRIVAGLGAGWQRAEYEASAVPWESRFGRLEEQIRAMRALWSAGPTSFAGRFDSYDRLVAEPGPCGGRRIPIWLGLGLGPRNLERIVELADGWLPVSTDVPEILREAALLRAACVSRGRDPDELTIRAMPASGAERRADGDLGALAADCATLLSGGVRVVQVYPYRLCSGAQDAAGMMRALVGMRDQVNSGAREAAPPDSR